MGEICVGRVHGRLGVDGRAGVLSGTLQWRIHRLPGPDRFPRVHEHQSVPGQERVLLEGIRDAAGAAGLSRLPGTRAGYNAEYESVRVSAGRTRAFRRAV